MIQRFITIGIGIVAYVVAARAALIAAEEECRMCGVATEGLPYCDDCWWELGVQD